MQQALETQGIHPEPKLLALRLGVPEAEVIEVEQGMTRDLSLSAPLSDGSDTTFSDTLPSLAQPVDEALADEEFQMALRERMEAFAVSLEPRDRDIFQARLLGDPSATLQEIGDRHGISREAGHHEPELRRLPNVLERRTASGVRFEPPRPRRGRDEPVRRRLGRLVASTLPAFPAWRSG